MYPQGSSSDLSDCYSADSGAERELPRPKRRKQTFGKRRPSDETVEEDADFSRCQSSSASTPLSTRTSGNIVLEEQRIDSFSSSPSSSSKRSHRGDNNSQYSDVFEESPGSAQCDQPSGMGAETFGRGTLRFQSKAPQKPPRLLYKDVQSKYLGTCKFLDDKVCVEETQPETVESIRAATYQKWFQEKKQATKEAMQLKTKEEMKKKKMEEADKKEAAAAYEAWKNMKAQSFEVKAKEKQDKVSKAQQEIEERRKKEERRESAKKGYEKWKREHDPKRQETYRIQREVEMECMEQRQRHEEERKRKSKCAFSSWCENKNQLIHERSIRLKTKAEEAGLLKEERHKMALEAYEIWLTQKEEKRQQEEKEIQTRQKEIPPPPWKPPSNTVVSKKRTRGTCRRVKRA